MENSRSRIITTTIERMRALPHLPGELVSLLGRTAQLQAESGTGQTLDLSGLDLSGSPLCPPDRLPLDRGHFLSLADRILDLVLDPCLELPDPMTAAAQVVKGALDKGELDLETALHEVLNRFAGGQQPLLDAWAEKTPGAPSFLAFLAAAAAAPSLASGAAALAEAAGLDRDQIHPRGSCPICGSLPYLLELQGKEGQRMAHCSLCRHTYRIRRLACAGCDTDQGARLRYFTAEGEPGFRVETCDHCRTYVKTIDFRQLDREAFAPLNDLESLALDILAGNQGFERMAPSVWCI